MTRRPTKREIAKGEKTPRLGRRYGIGEWYGRLLVDLHPTERVRLAKLQFQPKKQRPIVACPFRGSKGANLACTKEGGVCTLRLYQSDPTSSLVTIAPGDAGALVTLCPYRFQEAQAVHAWIGETLLNTANPLIASEVGFLEQETEEDNEGGSNSRRDVGRIDRVLVHPSLSPLTWCAVEMQAVYFSGRSMKKEFEALRLYDGEELPFPAAHRRPDFRSSGPKRLMPQLQIKVPTLRRWGKKMAVVVDHSFFNALGKMEEVKDISSSDIAWFVVSYEEKNGKATLRRNSVKLTTLERAVEGLTGGEPVALSEFEARIREKLADKSKEP